MKFLTDFLNKFKSIYITILRGKAEISKTREVSTQPIREIKPFDSAQGKPEKLVMESFSCPYCLSKKFVRRGFRQKKLERVQLYLCLSCNRTFTPYSTKGKHYPLGSILDAISIYNLGYSLEQTCKILIDRYGFEIQASTLSNWLSETIELCKFSRMREYALKKYSPKEMVIHATLAHRQLYRYRFHRAKCELMISEEFQHRKFESLKEFLEMVPVECPHQYFMEGLRASETPLAFSKKQMIVRSKQNYATRLCSFVLQSVKERKQRHEALQKFMLCNDSVTVACEVPVYLTKDDLEHMQTQLGFEIYEKKWEMRDGKIDKEMGNEKCDILLQNISLPNPASHIPLLTSLPKLITGHIDILQIRNGQIHILDYKPNAEKERPIEQLTLYAMALSRLTGLRLFEFKCAWFDEKDYFEFYPLHVLHKPRRNLRRRKVYTMEGTYQINRNINKIEQIRPNL